MDHGESRRRKSEIIGVDNSEFGPKIRMIQFNKLIETLGYLY